MSVILKSDHLKIVRRIKHRAIKIHLCGILFLLLSLLSPYAMRMEINLIKEAYGLTKMEFVSVKNRMAILRLLRSRALTVGQALDLVDFVMTQREVPVDLVLGLIDVESEFNPRAVSSKGAKGLAQVMSINHRSLLSIHDPVVNLTEGLTYLSSMKKMYGSWPPALRSYNGGPGLAHSKNLDPYVKLVLARADKYKTGGGEKDE